MLRLLTSLVVMVACATPCFGQAEHRLLVRVVDVGAGLCCVVVTPDHHYMIFDAGNYEDHGVTAMQAIEELIPFGSTIDLMVISHCDADHQAAIPFICENYKVAQVWRDGFDSGRQIWARGDQAIRTEAATQGCLDLNLQQTNIDPGHQIPLGQATVTFLCGFGSIPAAWGLNEAEDRNARSLVVRVDYGQASLLLTGDTVGRHIGDPDNTCIAAEKVLVDNAGQHPIDVDLIVAPHHGADNGSSREFVSLVSPRYVIFSANSKFHHPNRGAANRYLHGGVPAGNMFRTDRGDNEGAPEWRPRSGAAPDQAGDDDIEVRLARNGQIQVQYMNAMSPSFAPGPTVRRALSPQISRWANDESLWTERHDHLEDHTLESAGPPRAAAREMPGAKQQVACAPVASPPSCRSYARGRGCSHRWARRRCGCR